jgi:hypothetical protein
MSDGGFVGFLRRKGPELLLEAFFVVFAVLVALAVDQWNEGRELQARVERARAAIQAELRSNLQELDSTSATVRGMLNSMADLGARLERGEPVQEWRVDAEIPDFSDAAWETARVTGTVARMDYPWVLDVARVYETQQTAVGLQNNLMAALGGAFVRRPTVEAVNGLQGQLIILLQLYDNLAGKYRAALEADGS